MTKIMKLTCDTVKKNFISGANCPSCHQMDTIMRIINENNTEFVCVHCGFRKNQNDAPKTTTNKPQAVNKITIKSKIKRD